MPKPWSRSNIRWFEEPVLAEDVAGCAELARRTRIAIAGFETETGRDAFARLIDAGAIQVVQPDIVQVGGITEARKIAAYAQMRHLPFTSKNYSTIVSSAACLHLLYALPNGEYFECDQDPLPWRNEILSARPFAWRTAWPSPAMRRAWAWTSMKRSSRPGWSRRDRLPSPGFEARESRLRYARDGKSRQGFLVHLARQGPGPCGTASMPSTGRGTSGTSTSRISLGVAWNSNKEVLSMAAAKCSEAARLMP